MLSSRGLAILKTANVLKSSNKPGQLKEFVRNSGHASWNYRCRGPPPRQIFVRLAEGVQGFAWWWVLWHLVTEPGHIIGEFPYPDASLWTDEELGIPSLDE